MRINLNNAWEISTYNKNLTDITALLLEVTNVGEGNNIHRETIHKLSGVTNLYHAFSTRAGSPTKGRKLLLREDEKQS